MTLSDYTLHMIANGLLIPTEQVIADMRDELTAAGVDVPEDVRHMAIAVRKLRGVPNPGAC